jgi:hypothetical protein
MTILGWTQSQKKLILILIQNYRRTGKKFLRDPNYAERGQIFHFSKLSLETSRGVGMG